VTPAATGNRAPALRALLAGAIDYAGLFPPAQLGMAEVVANYHAYRRGPDAWALGRLVVPAARLDELADAAQATWVSGPGGEPWPISALVGSEVVASRAAIASFNLRHGAQAVVDSVESRAATPAEVRGLAGSFAELQHFVEIPLEAELPPLLSAIREIGARAKVRLGGVTVDAFPAARDVARFLVAAAQAGVAFKATAGLHHPLRGEYRLTYAADSRLGTMFGYLNVILAAAEARAGADEDAVVARLEMRRDGSIGIDEAVVRWGGGQRSAQEVAETRAEFALGFGSCSFREPLDDLTPLLRG